jgi:ABC-2 type transport system ATP-binding protein
MPDTVLRLRQVTKRFGTRFALRGMDLEVARGAILGLLGPNGSGKTTALRIAAGVLACDGGAVEGGGAGLRLGYLPERVPLYDALRVACNAVFEACDLEGWRHHPVGQLSKGTRQRVGLAQALLGSPDLLLLDEATSGLDPLQAREARRRIRRGCETRGTVFCTHVLHEAAALCTRVVIVRDGRVVAEHHWVAASDAARAAELEEVFLEALGAGRL